MGPPPYQNPGSPTDKILDPPRCFCFPPGPPRHPGPGALAPPAPPLIGPARFIPVRVARATVTMAVLRICALLLLFDCQEAFHCCLVVACINRINMISIECHRSGERCPGKREFDNRIEINRVRSGEIMWLYIPFNLAPGRRTCK